MAIKFHQYPSLVSFIRIALAISRINSGLQDSQPICSVSYLPDINSSNVVTLEIIVSLQLLPAQELFESIDTKTCNEVGVVKLCFN